MERRRGRRTSIRIMTARSLVDAGQQFVPLRASFSVRVDSRKNEWGPQNIVHSILDIRLDKPQEASSLSWPPRSASVQVPTSPRLPKPEDGSLAPARMPSVGAGTRTTPPGLFPDVKQAWSAQQLVVIAPILVFTVDIFAKIRANGNRAFPDAPKRADGHTPVSERAFHATTPFPIALPTRHPPHSCGRRRDITPAPQLPPLPRAEALRSGAARALRQVERGDFSRGISHTAMSICSRHLPHMTAVRRSSRDFG